MRKTADSQVRNRTSENPNHQMAERHSRLFQRREILKNQPDETTTPMPVHPDMGVKSYLPNCFSITSLYSLSDVLST